MTDGQMTDAAFDRVAVDGREYPTAGGTLDGAGVLAVAGLDPRATALVRVDGGTPRRVDPEAPVEGGGTPRFRSGAGGTVWTLLVDGVRWDWPQRTISVRDVVEIAGLPPGGPLRLAGLAGPLSPDGHVDLASGTARVTSGAHAGEAGPGHEASGLQSALPAFAAPANLRPAPLAPAYAPAGRLPIVVNGRPFDVPGGETTFEDLVRLAFPQLPADRGRAFTVTWRRGDLAHPQGSLAPRQAVRLAPGAVVDVASTVKG